VGRMRMSFDLWKYPIDGTAAENVRHGVRLTHQTGQVETPSAAPGDRELVYLSDSGGHGNLWVMKLDASEARQITYERDASVALGMPEWSPDGKTLYYATPQANVNQPDFEIRVARPENGPSRVLARIPSERIPSAAWTIHPLLSPDGKWVALLLAEGAGTNIWAIPAAGGQL